MQQGDRVPVHLREFGRGISDPPTPIGIGAPCCGLQHEPGARLSGDIDIGIEVVPQSLPAFLPPHQIERGEMREVDTIVEDEGRLQSAVR